MQAIMYKLLLFFALTSFSLASDWKSNLMGALAQLEEEKPQLALKLLEDLASEDLAFELQFALLAKKLGHHEKSLYVFDRILTKDPRHQLALLETADLLERMNLLEQSLKIYDQFLKEYPNHKIALRNRGSVHFKSGDCKSSVTDLQKSDWLHLSWVKTMVDQCTAKMKPLEKEALLELESLVSKDISKPPFTKSEEESRLQLDNTAPIQRASSHFRNKAKARELTPEEPRTVLSWWPTIEYMAATPHFEFAVELIEKGKLQGARRVLEGETFNPWSVALLDYLTARESQEKLRDIRKEVLVDSLDQFLDVLKMKHLGYEKGKENSSISKGPLWTYHLARQAMVESNSIESLKQLSLGMKQWPDRSEFYYLSAQIMHEMGRTGDRDAFFEKAQSIRNSHPHFPEYQ